MAGANNNGNAFAKTICSICYEDLKPLVEDLQSISICGHVFHELCLQQWFEYCPKTKKRNCPICKQSCTNANVGRLYFQSVGDPNDSNTSQKPRNYEENPEELQKEVNRLEGKVVALASSLEQQQKEFKEVKDQVTAFLVQGATKIEAALKNEALTQMATNQQLLRMRSEELDKSTLECMRVQERNMALAKELAAFKLASDLDLEDDEVMKLASLGNDAGSRETVDVLRKSLVIRNKSYKELMAKCNILGRGEARCLRKLEKATEKIKKLKSRIQELETAAEIKDNETLRVLKDQDARFNADSHENTMKRHGNRVDVDETSYKSDSTFISKKVDICMPMTRKSTIDDIFPGCTDEQNDQEKGRSSINEDRTVGNAQSGNRDGISCSRAMRKGRKADLANKLPANVDDEVICYGETGPVQTSVHIKKETTSRVNFLILASDAFLVDYWVLMEPTGTWVNGARRLRTKYQQRLLQGWTDRMQEQDIKDTRLGQKSQSTFSPVLCMLK
ncbi:UNVERIFIED_CONTAM: hypothetical protein Scaly_0242600 [Sesamum calycinum]|uniref:RING-type domain-containing protein n=1 Tax=Sesamum calycinum TaxID=2727403 RepID=A0AAW2T0J3_9LAMI